MKKFIEQHEYEYAAMVNHATDPAAPRAPTPESEEKLHRHRAAVEEINEHSARGSTTLLPGVEASVLENGAIDVTLSTLCSLSVVIASRHGASTTWTMDETIPQLQHIFQRYPVHILGHPTRYVPPQPPLAYRRLIGLCVAHRVAFELNLPNPFGPELVEYLVDCGVVISLGSDMHPELLQECQHPSLISSSIPIINALATAGFPEDRVVNTWPRYRLESWLAERQTMCNTLKE